jgi:hypothetical protein
MQQPLLKEAIEQQINNMITKNVSQCISDAENKIKSQGYNLKTSGTGQLILQLQPKKVLIGVDISMTLDKNGATQTYSTQNFQTSIDSGAYDLIMIASSIQNYEARYGDSNPDDYMALYPNIKVQKLKQDDGTKVYIITDRNTGESLQFATRSLAWPPGIAIQ